MSAADFWCEFEDFDHELQDFVLEREDLDDKREDFGDELLDWRWQLERPDYELASCDDAGAEFHLEREDFGRDVAMRDVAGL